MDISCTEVWGGTGESDVSVQLAGVRGECYSRPFDSGASGGDIHFLSVCGVSMLSKIVLADVSGHGEETSEVSGIIHAALVENINANDNSIMLEQVNRAFLERRTGGFKFTTMVSLIIDNRDRTLVYAYAGHPSILRGEAATGRFRQITPETGPRGGVPLGVLADEQYEQHFVQLEKGDVLVIYTDAFTEVRTPEGGFLGEEGLAQLLESANTMRPDELKEHVLNAVGDRFNDDASLIVLEVL
jgi:serine phosphatase RsbU (regulator of sigma subunit)